MTEFDYECHITLKAESPLQHHAIKNYVEYAHWRFSMIQGDPDLGTGIRCYATQLYHNKEVAIAMTNMMTEYFRSLGFHVVRCKVEQIIMDHNFVNEPIHLTPEETQGFITEK